MKKIILIMALILIDQLTKIIFPTTKNYGAAFGLLQNQTLFFILISIPVIIACMIFLKKNKHTPPVTLITAGTIGNLIDRLFLGYVRDFINLKIWPSFNIADALITIGFLLLLLSLIKKKNILTS